MSDIRRIDLTFDLNSEEHKKVYNFLKKLKRKKTYFTVLVINSYIEMLGIDDIELLNEEDAMKIALNIKKYPAIKETSCNQNNNNLLTEINFQKLLALLNTMSVNNTMPTTQVEPMSQQHDNFKEDDILPVQDNENIYDEDMKELLEASELFG